MPVSLMEIFEDRVWQMALGERAAVEGVLCQLQPALSIEIGTAEGASLKRIAIHSGQVHSFDLATPSLEVPKNVTLHTGDSHELLPRLLKDFAEQERSVDFVLVDGDHSPGGVRRDVEDLLSSSAISQAVILIHDTANERVREGLDAVLFTDWPKVTHVELDWVPGQVFKEPGLRNEIWCGLGLVMVGAKAPAYAGEAAYQQRYYDASKLLAAGRDELVARELSGPQNGEAIGKPVRSLQQSRFELEEARRLIESYERSTSWRLTAPLRALSARVRSR